MAEGFKLSHPWEYTVKDLVGYDQGAPPSWVREWIDAEHLSYNLRLKLTTFLYGNGVSPDIIRRFYRERQQRSRGRYLSRKGERHVETVLKSIESGSLKGWYSDLASGKGGQSLKRYLQHPNRYRTEISSLNDRANYNAQMYEDKLWEDVLKMQRGDKRVKKQRVPCLKEWYDRDTKVTWVLTTRQWQQKKKRDSGLPDFVPASTSK